MDVRINNGAQGAFDSRFTPGAAPARDQAAAPPASDRVTLGTEQKGAVTERFDRDQKNGIDFLVRQSQSGIKHEIARRGQEERFHVEIPQGLTPMPLEISGGGQQGQIVAHAAGNPQAQLPAQMSPDGKYVITLSPNGAMAVFDPTSMDFGVASPPTQQATPQGNSTYTALQEVIHADNSHTLTAHAQITDSMGGGGGMGMMGMGMMMPGGGTPTREVKYVQIDESATGQVTAKQVVEKQPLAPQSGFSKMMGGGPSRTETHLDASKLPNGSFAVGGGGSLWSHMKASMANPMVLQSPLKNWLSAKNQGPMTIPTFSSNPGLLASMSAAVGPMATTAMQMPFAAPPPAGFPR